MADGDSDEKKSEQTSESRPVGFRTYEEIPADEVSLELKAFAQFRKKTRGRNEKR